MNRKDFFAGTFAATTGSHPSGARAVPGRRELDAALEGGDR